MRKGRTLFLGGLVSAVVGLVAAPRAGESRREAMARLRAGLQRRGGVAAFGGTPCSTESPTDTAGPSPATPDDGAEGG
jgi:hypothetical protein